MSTSELSMIRGNKTLICCFGGMALKMGGIPPFEFVRYLSSIYTFVIYYFILTHVAAVIIMVLRA